MSVINKMLQDLDKREQSHGISNVAVPQILATPQRSKTVLALYCGVSLILGAGLLWIWQNAHEQSANDTLSQMTAGQQAVPTAQGPSDEVAPVQQATAQQVIEQVASEPLVASHSDTESVPPANATEKKVNTDTLQVSSGDEPTAIVLASVQRESTASNETLISPTSDVLAKATTPTTMPATTETKATATQPAIAPAQLAITEVKLTRSQLAQKQIANAVASEQKGQIKQAIVYYVEALVLDSSQHQARKQLAALYYGQGALAQAADVLAQGIVLYPKEWDFSLLLARVQQFAGMNSEALASLDIIPDSSELAREKWIHQSDIAQQLGRFELAEHAYRRLSQQEPKQGKWWMGLGFSLDSQGHYQAAVTAYKTALSLSGLSVEAVTYIDNRLAQLNQAQLNTDQTGVQQ